MHTGISKVGHEWRTEINKANRSKYDSTSIQSTVVHYEIICYGLYIEIILLLQGYGFNLEEALLHLTRHLKFRLFFDLDNVDKIKDNKILKQYFPLGLVGQCFDFCWNLLSNTCPFRVPQLLPSYFPSTYLSCLFHPTFPIQVFPNLQLQQYFTGLWVINLAWSTQSWLREEIPGFDDVTYCYFHSLLRLNRNLASSCS